MTETKLLIPLLNIAHSRSLENFLLRRSPTLQRVLVNGDYEPSCHASPLDFPLSSYGYSFLPLLFDPPASSSMMSVVQQSSVSTTTTRNASADLTSWLRSISSLSSKEAVPSIVITMSCFDSTMTITLVRVTMDKTSVLRSILEGSSG